MATTPAQTVSPLAMAMPEDEAYVQEVRASRKALQDALVNRQQLFDPTLLAMAQGFLAPTRSGGFGESLGNVAARVAPVQEQEQQRAVQMAQLRSEMATQELGERQATRRQEALGKMYKKDEAGNLTMDLDAALRYAQLTGDPKIFAEVAAKQKEMGLQSARDQVFKPTAEGKYQFDPSGLGRVFALGGAKELAEVVKSVPELRKMGLLGEVGAEGTPFDAIATLAKDPLIKQQAVEAAARYKKGLIDDKQAENLSKDMMQMHLAQFNAEQARAQTAAFNTLSSQLARERFEATERERAEKAEKERAKSGSELQTTVDAADRTISQIKHIQGHPGKESGLTAAIRPTQLIPGTDAYDFNEQIKVLKSQAFLASVQQMKGLGALSNAEGARVENALQSINPNMSKKEFDRALNEVIGLMELAKERARASYERRPPAFTQSTSPGATPAAAPAATPARPAGAVPRWNPATGKWE